MVLGTSCLGDKESSDSPKTRRNTLVGNPGVVKLMDRKKWIQVSYSGVESYCPVIHDAVDTAIHRAVDRFQHTGLDYPSVRYLCPLHLYFFFI